MYAMASVMSVIRRPVPTPGCGLSPTLRSGACLRWWIRRETGSRPVRQIMPSSRTPPFSSQRQEKTPCRPVRPCRTSRAVAWPPRRPGLPRLPRSASWSRSARRHSVRCGARPQRRRSDGLLPPHPAAEHCAGLLLCVVVGSLAFGWSGSRGMDPVPLPV